MPVPRWFVYAALGALFAAVVNVLTKKALAKTDPTLATTLQAALMLITLLVLTSVFGGWGKLASTPPSAIVIVCVAGVAAGLSWFFGYQALQLTDVSRATTVDRLSLLFAVLLAMIFLGERPSVLNWSGVALMLVGALCVAQKGGEKADAKEPKKDGQAHTAATEGFQTPTQRLPDRMPDRPVEA